MKWKTRKEGRKNKLPKCSFNIGKKGKAEKKYKKRRRKKKKLQRKKKANSATAQSLYFIEVKVSRSFSNALSVTREETEKDESQTRNPNLL